MKTKTVTMTGILDDYVEGIVILIRADPRYVSHTVRKETDGTNTIIAVFKVDE